MRKKKEKMTKREYVKLLTISFTLMGLGMAGLIVTIILSENDVNNIIVSSFGVPSLLVMVSVLIILLPQMKRIMVYTQERTVRNTLNAEHLIVSGVTKEKLISACKKQNFKDRDGEYLYKRKFSFKTDYVNYFVRFADVTDGVKNTVHSELQALDEKWYPEQNACFVLFLFSENGKEEDLEWLKEFSAKNVVRESVSYYRLRRDNVVAVLIDKQSEKGYIGVKGKFGAWIYNQGVKLVEKLVE